LTSVIASGRTRNHFILPCFEGPARSPLTLTRQRHGICAILRR